MHETQPESVYLNGEILPADRARVSVFDAGFTHAAGLFETMRVYNGRVFRLKAHLDRMSHSAAVLEMNLPIEHDTIQSAIQAVLSENKLLEARVRLVITPGNVPRPDQPDGDALQPVTLITASAVRRHPSEKYEQGMRVCISPYKQNRFDPLAGHKTMAYLPRLLAMKDAAERRCDEALWFTTENLLAEGCICNVFVVHDGKLLTPPLATPVLPGVSRQAVMELAQAHNIPVEERPINIDALLAAQEVFLTGSVLEIMPVTSIEKHVVGDGLPGPITQQLRRHYATLITRECPPEN